MDKKLSLSDTMHWQIAAILGVTPIFFLPLTQNFYDTNKWMLLAVGALTVLTYWVIELFRVKTPLHRSLSWAAIGFGTLTIASTIGLITSSTNKIEALLSPLGPVTFLSLALLTVTSRVTKKDKTRLTWFLYIATGIVGLIAIYQSLGMGKLMFPRVSYLQNPLWTPTGSVSTNLALFFITLSLLIPDMIAAIKKRENQSILALLVVLFVTISIGTCITLWEFFPNLSTMLPFSAGWTIATQIFHNPISTAVGVGVENFLTAFTISRPASFNATALGAVNFTTNANFFLHILTVYGVIGLAAAGFFAILLFRGVNTGWLLVTKIICLTALCLIPPTIPLLTVIAVVFILSQKEEVVKFAVIKPWIRMSLGILILGGIIASLYFLARSYSAELYFFRSLEETAKNDGTKTYNLQIQAIETNTFVSRYHSTYSQTSLSLANSIASTLDNGAISTNSGTKNDQDRQLISKLVQQAIREAKIAVNLNTSSVVAWENLGFTYQTIMPLAPNADTWAITAYESATKLDPSNPTLYVNIGSVYVHQQKYDNAIAAFAQAIRLNPSYANAYYNLANVYTLKGDTVDAATALAKTMDLVPPGSTDYFKVKNELNTLQHTMTPAGNPSPTAGASTLTLP